MAGASSITATRIFVFCASLRSRHLEANRLAGHLLSSVHRAVPPSVTAQRTSAIVGIVDSPPTWMDEAELARMRETPLWLDEDPPQGLLRALVADRERE
jgi:hypothetical protein